MENRIDAAVAAGRLTQEQATRMKERLRAAEVVPFLGRAGGPHLGRGGGEVGLDAAAEYLGLTQAELRERLRAGSTLAEVARATGKTADGLVAALVADARERLEAAVADGRLTAAQRDRRLERVQERVRALVNGERRAFAPRARRS
jgi:hypothetical protein